MQFGQLRRREFITLLGGAAATWPLGARAQQTGKLPKIGFLGGQTASAAGIWIGAFVERLRELGWIEGRTVAIEVRWAEGRRERYAAIAAEFVQLGVDVIVASNTPAAIVAKNATSVIPIVFPISGDPVVSGLVASLARPGGNVTGLATQNAEIAGKRLALLRELIPGLRQLGIVASVENPAVVADIANVQAAARTLGLEVTVLELRQVEDIAPALDALKGRANALYFSFDPLTVSNRLRIIPLVLALRLPTIHYNRDDVEAGGLMSYGPNTADLFRRAAEYVDKILRGTKPSDIPVEQPTQFELVINLKTAKALDLTVPVSLIARANEVIE